MLAIHNYIVGKLLKYAELTCWALAVDRRLSFRVEDIHKLVGKSAE